MKILFAASEAVPFAASGGLADVVGSLPKAIKSKRHDCRVVMPLYKSVAPEFRDKMVFVTNITVDVSWRKQYCGIFMAIQDGITYYFIDNEYYFYGPKPYEDGIWDLEKFAYFSKAALSILPLIDFQPDVIHCHDWQTGLVPVYLKTDFCRGDFFSEMNDLVDVFL